MCNQKHRCLRSLKCCRNANRNGTLTPGLTGGIRKSGSMKYALREWEKKPLKPLNSTLLLSQNALGLLSPQTTTVPHPTSVHRPRWNSIHPPIRPSCVRRDRSALVTAPVECAGQTGNLSVFRARAPVRGRLAPCQPGSLCGSLYFAHH